MGELDPVWGPFAPPPPGVASHRHKTKLLLEWKEANLPTRWERFLAFAKELPLRAAAKPTPEFNLPVEGWGTNPDTVLAELEKRRGKLKYPKKRRGGSKPMFISMDDDDLKLVGEGPVLDWACLNLRQFLNSELKHLRGKTSLDLSHNPLTEIPIGLGNHHQLRHVTLHDCDLTDESIPRSFFTGLSQLQVLDISVNQEITEIGEEYGDLSGLRRLVAHNCRIYRVDNQIQRCPLEHLELQCNKLTSLPAGIIRLRALAYLDVEQNCMDFLPVFFGRGVRGCQNTRNLPSLRRLNLGVNHFSELPPGLPGLDRLESLWLHRSYLQKLPDDLGDMIGLKQLTAYGNGLREIPDSVSGLVSLETMALNDNTIGPDLPESMFGMTSLLSLDLCDNKIQALPTRLGELPNLRHLWLARNQIEVLPEGIGQLTTLESLHVHENKIKKLPSNLAGMKHLKSLTLARNVLDNLPPTFKGLTSLERLTMDHNVTIMELALQGMLFTGLVNLGAMTIDRFVFDQCDKRLALSSSSVFCHIVAIPCAAVAA